MSSSTFYSAHILPSRPASLEKGSDLVKRSSYKKVSKFLQAAEKQGLLKLKDFKGDLNILSVNATHQDVITHRSFKTMRDVEVMESRSKEAEPPVQHMIVVELYKPHTQSLAFFQQLDNTVWA
jgi:translation initiation factor 2D